MTKIPRMPRHRIKKQKHTKKINTYNMNMACMKKIWDLINYHHIFSFRSNWGLSSINRTQMSSL